MEETIKHYEGARKDVYTDTNSEEPKRTVGVGFNMDQSGARETFEKYVPDASFDKVRNGQQSLTDAQVNKLYEGTLNEKVKKTKDIFPSYNTYPKAVQTALVNGVFRGEFKKSHKTVDYINKGQWDKVPEEYVRPEGLQGY